MDPALIKQQAYEQMKSNICPACGKTTKWYSTPDYNKMVVVASCHECGATYEADPAKEEATKK